MISKRASLQAAVSCFADQIATVALGCGAGDTGLRPSNENAPLSPPDVIVFDIGAVLVDWNPRYLFRKITQDEARIEHFLAYVANHIWHVRHDAGVPFAENRRGLIAAFPQWQAWIEAYGDRFFEMFGGPVAESVGILEEIRAAGLPTYAITNWPGETFSRSQELFPFLKGFQGVVVSGYEGVLKPDPRIYRLLFDRFRLDPARCLFIDDSPANVAGAEAVGMPAIHFTDPARMRADLVARGVPIRA
jgi:2-haloacid dehalogenase